MDTKEQLNTADEVIEANNAVVEEAAEKIKQPIIKNMAEKIYFDLGAYNIPARVWYKPQEYVNVKPHEGKREVERRAKRGWSSPRFDPKPSHPDAPIRNPDEPSRQVLRRAARKAGTR